LVIGGCSDAVQGGGGGAYRLADRAWADLENDHTHYDEYHGDTNGTQQQGSSSPSRP
jgi:hypothetical protein